MPGRDRTGPTGRGVRSGRGAGDCAGTVVRGEFGSGGFGVGRRCRNGRRAGFGFGRGGRRADLAPSEEYAPPPLFMERLRALLERLEERLQPASDTRD